ncbi:hypothetical protein SAMN02745163_03918 [Clostridium cavendishii DSM 21758]|uniref:Uncharacterized protein n=1 Tax=Clostridium cavendishii DSM 21758 TaxID=1121302 RepID=A0A1M6SY52_9CLOT|nr:hypothetical protein [Clostridium cavendishii]SHK49634.1 hypothetical protein SAMN02745163_03918 [Clostridium cavendishii DSM 21758]
MVRILDNELIKSHKDKIIVSTLVMTIVIFFIFDNISMLTPNFIWSKTYHDNIVQKFFSISFIRFVVLYISYGIVTTVFLKDKRVELQSLKDDQYAKIQWLISKMLCIYTSFLMPLIINTIIKLILYKMSYNFYHEKLGIGVSVIFIFFIFQCLLAFCGLQSFILSHLLFGDLLKATIFPALFVEFIFTTFGMNSLIISKKLDFINYIIGPIKYNIINNLVDIIFWDGRLELQEKVLQLLLLALTLLIGILILSINYFVLNYLNVEKLESKYASKYIRIIYHIILAVMIGFYIPAAIAYYIAIINPKVSLDHATYSFNIISLITIPLIFLFVLETPIWKLSKNKLDKTI